MSNQLVAMYHGEEGSEAIYVATNITDITHAITMHLRELFDSAGFCEGEVVLVSPAGIVNDKTVACLAHSYDPDGSDWFNLITIESVEFIS